MSGFEAFALACNILQVASLALKTISLCKYIYDYGDPQLDLLKVGKAFDEAHASLQTSLVEDEVLAELSPEDDVLLDISQECSDASKELQDELEKQRLRIGPGQWRSIPGAAARMLWKSRTIERLRRKFQGFQQLLQTRILIDLRKRYDVYAVQQTQRLDDLDMSFKSFFLKITNNTSDLTSIVDQYCQSICEHITTELEELKLNLAGKEHYEKVLDSLFFPEMTSRQERIPEPYKDTFEWVFAHNLGLDQHPWDDFLDWLVYGSEIYWICGKLGSGKSTLMRFIYEDERSVDALMKWSRDQNLVILGFFLWKAGEHSLQKSLVGLLRTLLYQLLEQQPHLTAQVVPEQTSRIKEWTEKRLQNVLVKTLKEGTHKFSFCIFIDGLDELDGDMEDLITLVKSLSRISKVKLCVSSRPDIAFERCLVHFKRMKMHDLTGPDIKCYIKGRLHESLEDQAVNHVSKDQISILTQKLQHKAGGVFLWVKLAVDSLRQGILNGDTYGLLEARFDQLPSEIDDLYAHMLSSIHPVYQGRVARFVRVVMTSLCPQPFSWFVPSVTVLTMALTDLGDASACKGHFHVSASDLEGACRRTEQQIFAQCAGFLSVRPDLDNDPSFIQIPTHAQSERNKVQSRYVIGKYDTKDAEIHFSHRTVFDYFFTHAKVLDSMEKDLPKPWNASNALANGHVRRMQILPWIHEMVSKELLTEPDSCMEYLVQAEQTCSCPFPETVKYLDQVMHEHGIGLTWSESWCNHWTQSLHCQIKYEFCKTSAFSIDGVCAMWGLKYYVEHLLKSANPDVDYLLLCATTSFQIIPPEFHVLNLIEFLLEAGANPNTVFNGIKVCCKDQQTGIDRPGRCTPWTIFLSWIQNKIRDRSPFSVLHALNALSLFLRWHANSNAFAAWAWIPVTIHLPTTTANIYLHKIYATVVMSPFCLLDEFLRNDEADEGENSSEFSHEDTQADIRHTCRILRESLRQKDAKLLHKIGNVRCQYTVKDTTALSGASKKQTRSLLSTHGLSFGDSLKAFSLMEYRYSHRWDLYFDAEKTSLSSAEGIQKFVCEVSERLLKEISQCNNDRGNGFSNLRHVHDNTRCLRNCPQDPSSTLSSITVQDFSMSNCSYGSLPEDKVQARRML